MSDYVVLDIESTGKNALTDELLCVGIGSRVYPAAEGRTMARALMLRPGTVIVAATNFDLRWLMLEGARLGERVHFHDLKVMAWMLDSTQPLDVESLTEKYVGRTPDKRIKQIANRPMFRLDSGEYAHMADVPWDQLERYNASDLKAEGDLYEALRAELRAKGMWHLFLKEEAPFSKLLVEVEATGMPFDKAAAIEMQATTDADIDRLEHSLVEVTGAPNFNVRSKDQVARFLYTDLWQQPVRIEIPRLVKMSKEEKLATAQSIAPKGVRITRVGRDYAYGAMWLDGMGLRPPKRDKKQKTPRPSVSSKKLLVLHGANPWIQDYIGFSKHTKLAGYLRDWIARAHEVGGGVAESRNAPVAPGEVQGSRPAAPSYRLYGRFDQSGTATGRLSAREPNLQQVATDGPVRDLFRGPLFIGDYCVAPNMRVLRGDLRWVAAETLGVGDKLVGFDEKRGADGHRCLRPATVTALTRKWLPSIRVVTDRGTWQVSDGHSFLVRSPKRLEWKRAGALIPGDSIAWFGAPWNVDATRDAGYLAGFFDGEGWVCDRSLGYAQLDGPTLDGVQLLMRERGFDPGRKYGSNSSAVQYQIRGGLYEDLRLLGSIRPGRLLNKAEKRWNGIRVRNGVASPAATVLQVESVGEQEVVAFSTSTKTFLMEGSFSHNSQLEVRLAAHFSHDPVMMDIFESGRDMYGTLAAEAWGGPPTKENENRALMKTVYLGSQYGAAGETLAFVMAVAGIPGVTSSRADEWLRDLKRTLPRMFAWRQEVIAQAEKDGYVETLAGRRRQLASITSADWQKKGRAERQAVNTVVQGSAADIMRRAMLAARQAVDPAVARMCLQVHDELLWVRGPEWCEEVAAELTHICETAHGFDLTVPLTFESKVAESWGEKDGGVSAVAHEHLEETVA